METFVMNGTDLGADWVMFVIVVLVELCLSLFGLWFNGQIEHTPFLGEGWAWLQVVFGVAVTLAGIALLDLFLDWNAGWIGLLAFAASGWPMVRGARMRQTEASERARKAIQDLRHD